MYLRTPNCYVTYCLQKWWSASSQLTVWFWLLSHGYLKMWIAHTFRNLLKQRFLDFLELRWLDNVENLLDFPQEHDLVISKEMQETEWGAARWRRQPTAYLQTDYLFLTAGFRPKLKKPTDHLHRWQEVKFKSCSSLFLWVAVSNNSIHHIII